MPYTLEELVSLISIDHIYYKDKTVVLPLCLQSNIDSAHEKREGGGLTPEVKQKIDEAFADLLQRISTTPLNTIKNHSHQNLIDNNFLICVSLKGGLGNFIAFYASNITLIEDSMIPPANNLDGTREPLMNTALEAEKERECNKQIDLEFTGKAYTGAGTAQDFAQFRLEGALFNAMMKEARQQGDSDLTKSAARSDP